MEAHPFNLLRDGSFSFGAETIMTFHIFTLNFPHSTSNPTTPRNPHEKGKENTSENNRKKMERQKKVLLGEKYVYAFMYTECIFYLLGVRMEMKNIFLRRQFTPHSIVTSRGLFSATMAY